MFNTKPSFNQTLSKNKVEIFLLFLSLATSILSILIYYISTNTIAREEAPIQQEIIPTTEPRNHIFIDVSGSVLHPDLYEVTDGARLKDAIKLAGGISDEADKAYFGKHFNLARLLSDQEKIYIPSQLEINAGFIPQAYESTIYSEPAGTTEEGISINEASNKELESLPGVGVVTAQKIIDNRPYTSIDELIDKAGLTQTIFEKIKEEISL